MNFSRRKFLKAAGITSVSGLVLGQSAWASERMWSLNSNTLKVGLIGCGGRGTAAAMEALNADPNVVLYAMADAFSDHLEESYKTLKKEFGEKVQVQDAQKFVGLEAYKELLAQDVDVVLLLPNRLFDRIIWKPQ